MIADERSTVLINIGCDSRKDRSRNNTDWPARDVCAILVAM
jgi:hypothetical protein